MGNSYMLFEFATVILCAAMLRLWWLVTPKAQSLSGGISSLLLVQPNALITELLPTSMLLIQ